MKFRNWLSGKEMTVEGAILQALDSSSDNYGTVEQLREEMNNLQKSHAKLVVLLHSSGILKDEELVGFTDYHSIRAEE